MEINQMTIEGSWGITLVRKFREGLSEDVTNLGLTYQYGKAG